MFLAGEAKNDVRITFLTKCGIEWESIFAGALLNSEDTGKFGAWHAPYLKELTAYGSDKAARMVAELSERAKPDYREDYAEALAGLISKPAELRYVSGRDFSRISKTPLTNEAQVTVVDALQRLATPNALSRVASIALKALETVRPSGSTKETLRALMKHPSPEVSEHAVKILRSMGERVEVSPASAAPVRFEILMNGKPLPPGLEIDWKVQSGSAYRGSTTTVDGGGTITIERSAFLNPEQKPTGVVFGSRGGEALPDPYFWIQVPAPANLDKLTRGNVEVLPVNLALRRVRPAKESAPSKAKVRLQRHQLEKDKAGGGFALFDPMQRDLELPLDNPVDLSLQKGTYDIEAVAEQATKLRQTFTIKGKGPCRLNLHLQPGGDVRFVTIRPDGQHGASCVLFRNGKQFSGDEIDFDRDTNTCRGLPLGNYVLHIPPSAELASKKSEFLDYAPLHGYVGRDVPFVISGETPLVDLGEIHLKPAD